MKLEKGQFVSCRIQDRKIIAMVGNGYEDFVALYFNYDLSDEIFGYEKNVHDPENGYKFQYITNLRFWQHLYDYNGFVKDIKIIENMNTLRME